MSRRTQGLKLDPDLSSGIPLVYEPVLMDDRGRLGLPLEVIEKLTWLAHLPDHSVHALGVLDEPGRIVLHAWEEQGLAVVAERTRLIKQHDYENAALLDVRYRRVQIPKDGRLTLTLADVLHLNLDANVENYVFVALVGNVIWILAPPYRNKLIERATRMFPQLP